VTTFKEQIPALLDEHPELAENTAAVVERIGCSPSTARTYINSWLLSQEYDWILDRACKTQDCERCDNYDTCLELVFLGLPIACERVCEADRELASNNGMWGVYLALRAEAAQ
jgi:hypothetical protein